MPSHATMVAWNVGLAAGTWLLVRKKSWWAVLAFVPVLIAGAIGWGTFDELLDPHIGPAVLHELGWSYVILGLTPFILVHWIVLIRLSPTRRFKRSTG